MIISVTQTMIDIKEMRIPCKNCPIAQSINVVLKDTFFSMVSGYDVKIYDQNHIKQYRALLPQKSIDFIETFDLTFHSKNERPTPFLFDIYIPENLLKEAL